MTMISVNAEHSYQVKFTNTWCKDLSEILKARVRVAIIVSETYSPDLKDLMNLDSEIHVFRVPDGEDGKSIATLHKLWNWLGAAGFTRSDLIVGIGGGAITDVAGFVAAS
jgi:3-dehydroquinate synthase